MLINTLDLVDEEVIGAVVRTRNCVGDIFHYQDENAGEYRLKGKTGHLTIRAYRKHASYQWRGEYPLEGYMDRSNHLLNNQDDKLLFVNTYYYHLTHLKRSNAVDSKNVIDRIKKYKYEIGEAAYEDEIPSVFNLAHPKIVPDPFTSYLWWERMIAHLVTPLKKLKRRLNH
jgi:hypothetical protein